MRRLERLCLIAVLLALPLVLATLVPFRGEPVYAQGTCGGGVTGDAQNALPCRMFDTFQTCSGG